MLIRRIYLSIKRECVALIFFLFCGFLFTETRKETSGIPYLTQGVVICYNIYTIYSMGDYGNMKCPYCAHAARALTFVATQKVSKKSLRTLSIG